MDAGYDKLNEAIESLTADANTQGFVVMDAVLVVGLQRLDENGHRIGGVGLYMRDGSGPVYAVKGLLTDALDTMRDPRPMNTCDDCAHGQ